MPQDYVKYCRCLRLYELVVAKAWSQKEACADYATNPNRILLKTVYELLQQREMY